MTSKSFFSAAASASLRLGGCILRLPVNRSAPVDTACNAGAVDRVPPFFAVNYDGMESVNYPPTVIELPPTVYDPGTSGTLQVLQVLP